VSDVLDGRRAAIIGYGNQGEAHAHHLRASGLDVVVGARPEGAGAARARAAGFAVTSPRDALRGAGVAALLLPDEALPGLWPGLADAVGERAVVVFAHGFNLLYGGLAFPAGADVVLVSPTAPGSVVLRDRGARGPLPAYLAVYQDGSGAAWQGARSYAGRLHLGPLLETTVREETEVDLFGEQAVLCGGLNALTLAAFETLVAHGYSPRMAYLECVHQVRYLAELLNERGPAGFREAISGTARYGDLTRGPRVVGEPSRRAMAELLEEIRSGAFAREWRAEVAAGRPRLEAAQSGAAARPIEDARRQALDPGTGPAGPEPSKPLPKN
jgi:ketol-acid reductoisomerase